MSERKENIVADFTTVTIDYNTGTDAASVWTGATITFAGTAGANEFRWQRTGGGGVAGTASAAWPNIIKPGANAVVEEMWAFKSDAVGLKINYDGTTGHPQHARFNFDALGSPASAMQFTAYQDSVPTAPTPGTQTANAVDGRNIINGHATDTTSSSYFKINAFGTGVPAAGQETPATSGVVGATMLATSGTAGSVSPGTAAWLATWQSAQGLVQYITAPAIWKVTTAGFWYINSILWVGPNMQTGIMVWTPFFLSYTWT